MKTKLNNKSWHGSQSESSNLFNVQLYILLKFAQQRKMSYKEEKKENSSNPDFYNNPVIPPKMPRILSENWL